MIKHSFLKYKLSSNLGGTEDDQIKLWRIVDYTVFSAEKDFTLLKDNEESGSESKFTEVNNYYSNDLTEFYSELESD